MIVIFLGGPGAGKGTQALKLANSLNAYHINTGQIIRDHIKNKTEIGVVAKPYIDAGHFIPDEYTISMIKSEILQNKDKDIVLDGFPRNIKQAEALKQMLKECNQHIGAIFNLDVPTRVMFERALKRGQETGREDDIPELIKQRIVDYYEISEPLKDHYCSHRWYYDIEGNQADWAVHELILQKIWWYTKQ